MEFESTRLEEGTTRFNREEREDSTWHQINPFEPFFVQPVLVIGEGELDSGRSEGLVEDVDLGENAFSAQKASFDGC